MPASRALKSTDKSAATVADDSILETNVRRLPRFVARSICAKPPDDDLAEYSLAKQPEKTIIRAANK